MKTKVLTTTKIEKAPASKPFASRMNLTAAERDLFLGTKHEFEAFKELMNAPTRKLEWREVHARAKGGELDFEKIEKPVIDPETGKPKVSPRSKRPVVEKVLKLDDEGNPVPVIKQMLLPKSGPAALFGKSNEYIVDTEKVLYPPGGKKKIIDVKEEFKTNEKGRFECNHPSIGKITSEKTRGKHKGEVMMSPIPGPGNWLRIRIDGPISDVRAMTKALMDVSLDSWQPITESDIGLDKYAVSENDRNSGAWCSDTIRAYIEPKRVVKKGETGA